MNTLATPRLSLQRGLTLIVACLLAQNISAQEKELPAASAQRILRSAGQAKPVRAAAKKPQRPQELTSTPIWLPGHVCPIEIARYGFVQVGRYSYFISGITTGGSVSTGVYRYDSLSHFWITLAPIPVGTEGAIATYSGYDNKIYVADGISGQNLLRIYDIANNSWSAATARPGVTDSFGGAIGASTNGQINIAGGNSGGANNVLSNYNIPNGVWSTINNMPTRFYGGGFAQIGRFLYLIGGYGITSTNSNVSMRLDMGSHTWTTGPTFSPQRADFALAAAGSKLFAIGGDASGGGFFDASAEVSELETSTWPSGSWLSSMPDLPSPRQGNSAGLFSTGRIGAEIWSTGGFTTVSPSVQALDEHLFRALPCPSITFNGPLAFHYQGFYPGVSGTQKGFFTNGAPSVCGQAKTVPAILNPTISFSFDAYSFTNNGPAACVTFAIETQCNDASNNAIIASAYLGSFDPNNIAKNYLGDMGERPPLSKNFSVDVPANATVVLVVQQTFSMCNIYSVSVTGLNCSEFCSTDGPILIPGGAGNSSGPASPYPSTVPVASVPGAITSMSVELHDIGHSFSADVDALLVSPTGQKMILVSDVGSSVGFDNTPTLVLRDSGLTLSNTSAIETGLYVPTNYESTNDTFPAPAPAGPYNYPGPGGTPAGTASLNSSFGGFGPNGNWQLYLFDDASMDAGFLGSWCLKFNTLVFQLNNAVSRKSHNGTFFDIDLPFSGQPGVECRTGGGSNNHTLVFSFTSPVVGGNASITSSLGPGHGSVSGSPTFSNNQMTVNLTGVTDQQTITVNLSNVTDAFGQVLPNMAVKMIVLFGDTNGNKSVNSSDISQAKAKSGAIIDTTNFRTDTNVSGTINSSDVAQVKASSGHAVP